MKKYILLCCLLSSWPFLLPAQNKPHTILWEVSKPGIGFKSYLFGTFHQVNPAFFDSLANANKKLKSSTKLFVEAMPEQNASAESLAIRNPMYAWDFGKWDSILTKPQKDTFAAFVKKSENPVYYSISPANLLVTLQYTYLQNFCDSSPRENYLSMDFYITAIGRKNKMRIIALDKDQLQILKESQAKDSLLSTRLSIRSCIGLMAKMLQNDASECGLITTYKNFDLDYEFDKNPAGLKVLLEDRNKKWMDVLPKAFEQEQCFVAVGFRHLFYGYGLIESLKRSGFKVEAISTE